MMFTSLLSVVILASNPFVNTHRLHCQDPWFHYLHEKKKTVEGRLNKGACSLIKAGDQIEFYNGDHSFFLTVTRIQHFATLVGYLKTVGLQNALPEIKTIQEGCEIYLKFYSEDDLQKFGILAFTVQ